MSHPCRKCGNRIYHHGDCGYMVGRAGVRIEAHQRGEYKGPVAEPDETADEDGPTEAEALEELKKCRGCDHFHYHTMICRFNPEENPVLKIEDHQRGGYVAPWWKEEEQSEPEPEEREMSDAEYAEAIDMLGGASEAQREAWDGGDTLDAVAFAKRVLGLDLAPWQEHLVLERNPDISSVIEVHLDPDASGFKVWEESGRVTPRMIELLTARAAPDDPNAPVDVRTVLEEASDVVDGPRQSDYGYPDVNHGTTADIFAAFARRRYGKVPELRFDAIDVCAFNIAQKLSRLANSPDHRDSLVDIAGYVRNWEMILDRWAE